MELDELHIMADKDDADAQFELGKRYARGENCNVVVAAKCYQKAAEHGHADAQYELAWMYFNCNGVPCDEIQAGAWAKKAADQHNARALYLLGYCCVHGRGGMHEDETQAVEWWRQAANLGYVHAQYVLGDAYFNGRGIPQSYEQALSWFAKAANQGDVDAKDRLSLMHNLDMENYIP